MGGGSSGKKTKTCKVAHLLVVLWSSRFNSVFSNPTNRPPLKCLARTRGREYGGKTAAVHFALRLHSSRALLLRCGSTTGEADIEANADWLKVKSVADVRSAISPTNETSVSDLANATESVAVGEDDANDTVLQGAIGIDEESENVPGDRVYTKSDLTFGASRPGDGSESDPDGLPSRFLKMQKGNRENAKKAFAHTLAWRAEHNIDTVLWEPHPTYDLCKSIYPHYFPGRDIVNNPILIQAPGRLDLEKAHKYNISMDHLLMDFVFAVEYCWNIMEPGPPDGVMTTVVDMRGVTFKHICNGEMRDFILRSIHVVSENYPQRSFRTLVINTPKWFGGLFRIIKPLLRESTKKKIEILVSGPNQDMVLRKYLGDESLPTELLSVVDISRQKEILDDGGENTVAESGTRSSIEQEMRAFVLRRLEQSGLEMQDPGK